MAASGHRCRIVALLIGFVSIATACGGTSAAPEEKWAAAVCTAFAGWEQEMQESVITPTARILPAPGRGTRVTVFRTIAEVERLTQELEAELARLDPPTKAARRAQEALVDVVHGAANAYSVVSRRAFAREFRKLRLEPTTRESAGILVKLNKTVESASLNIVDHALAVMVVVEPSMEGIFLAAPACDGVVTNP